MFPIVSRPLAALSAVAMALVASLIIAVRADATWSGQSADQMISYDDNEYARYVQLWSVGDVYALWAEDSPSVREILFGRSTDSGVTWSCSSADRVISFPDGNPVYDKPSLTGDAQQRLLAVWSEIYAGTREVHFGVSTDQGTTWSSETQDQILSDPATAFDTGPPSATINWDGICHVVWTQNSGGTSEVYYSRSTDFGQTWSGLSGDRRISFPDGANAVAPEIVSSGEDLLVVVWREVGDAGLPVLHAGRSTDDGLTWSSETADQEIAQPANLITALALDASKYGNEIYAVYTASFDTASPYHYEVYATSSADGVSWSGEGGLIPVSFDEDHTRSASNPDVFTGTCGATLAAWDEEDEASGTQEQHYSQFENDVWDGASGDQILSFPDGEDGYRPSITGERYIISLRSLETVYAAWTEFAGGTTDNYEVHLSYTNDLCSVGAVGEPGRATPQVRAFPNPALSAVRFEAEALSGGLARVEIFDTGGRLVRALTPSAGTSGAPVSGSISWDRRDRSGRLAPAGVYRARILTAAGPASRVIVLL